MNKKVVLLMIGIVVVAVLGGAATVMTNVGGQRNEGPRGMAANLRGFDEVPAISSLGGGRFNATVNEAGTEITWDLSYANLTSTATQAHLHFAQPAVNGGIVVFLCSNLGGAPAGTQACPLAAGTIGGTINSTNIGSGANAQGIEPGEISEFLRAIRAGIVYANVHSSLFPGGEIRGQVNFQE